MPIGVLKRLVRPEREYPAFGAVEAGEKGVLGALRLSWVWTTATHGDANLGDALSAVVVAALSGLDIKRSAFDSDTERLAAVGTIGHAFCRGKVHFWGTGFDMARNRNGALAGYQLPEDTDIAVHAVRGRETAVALRQRGLHVPENYGDPVWFLPKIFPAHVEKTHDLGVIVHISELETPNAASLVKAAIERYRIPAEFSSRIRIINTYAPASITGLKAKVEEIVSCRRILSTSLHGLVIAETYGIPCAWFANDAGESGPLYLSGVRQIDHRMRDFYSGVGRDYVLAFLQPRNLPTDWGAAIRFLDSHWRPLVYSGRELFRAFPLRNQQRFSAKSWRVSDVALERLPF